MDYQAASQKLASIEQEHLLAFYDKLSEGQQQRLLRQIEAIDGPLFHQQQVLLKTQAPLPPSPLDPFQNISRRTKGDDFLLGQQKIAEGQVGCLIIAGGQGTRLRFDGPKGLYPVSVIKQKTLFQLFAEKILAASQQAGRDLLVAIMTSPTNHEATVNFFLQHNYFGLKREQVSFFSQKILPLLDEEGNLFLEEVDSLAQGPDGNGSSLKYFIESGLWHRWDAQGVKHINFVLVDNPLADPFDAELIGFHIRQECDITVKCTPRRDIHEKVGVLVEKEGKAMVIEYSEIAEEERKAQLPSGALKHPCANLSLYCFRMDNAKELAQHDIPFHIAHKAAKYMDRSGKSVQAMNPMAWKFEKFIFDLLPLTKRVKALMYPRYECFAPLKNFSGPDSLETVRAALLQRDRRIFEAITGQSTPEHHPFELAQEFYYPTPELLSKWKGRSLPDDAYIEP